MLKLFLLSSNLKNKPINTKIKVISCQNMIGLKFFPLSISPSPFSNVRD